MTTIVWEHRTSRENRKAFSSNHEYLLVYAKYAKGFAKNRNLLALSKEVLDRYQNPDNDPRGPWQSVSANVQAGHGTPDQFYALVGPTGKVHVPPKGRCWAFTLERMNQEIADNNIWFGRDGNGVPRIKRFLSDARSGLTPETLWKAEDVGTTSSAKKHLKAILPQQEVFDTPKPEALIQRVLEIASSPGDLVLDAYLGSGTTAAVAHRMRRSYIGIEQGDHAETHCAKRLAHVINGDASGLSNVSEWRGGGGFDFFRLEGAS